MKIIVKFLLLCCSFSVCAQNQAVALWQQVAVTENAPLLPAKNRLRQITPVAQVTLNIAVLEQLTSGDSLNITLDGTTSAYIVSHIQHHSGDIRSYIAQSTEGSLVLTVSGQTFFASLSHHRQRYSVQGLNNVGAVFLSRDITPKNPGAAPDYRIPTVTAHGNHSGPAAKTVAQPTIIATSDDPARLDLLVYYTASADALYGGDAQGRIFHMITVANQIFADSDVAASINPVQLIKVDYDATMQGQALNELEYGVGPFADIKTIRYEQGADFVTLIQPFVEGDGSCGLANLTHPYVSWDYQAFSVNAIDCDDYVLAHEIGHNLGLNHSRRQDDRGYITPYALGYGVNDEFVTVMAYESEFFTGGQYYPDKIYRFSNPEQQCNGQACGIADPDPDSADAARALRLVVKAAENRFSDTPDLTTIADALQKVESAPLRRCIERGLDYSAKYAAQAVTDLYCWNEAIDSLEGIEYFSGIKTLQLYKVTATDSSPLAQLTQVTNLTISDSQLSDYSFMLQMPQLYSLSLYSTNFTELSLLEQIPNLQYLAMANTTLDMAQLPQLDNLTWLDLPNVGLTNLNFVSKVPNLTFLSVSANNISSLEPLRNSALQTLYADSNRLVDISPVATMTSLQSLQLNYNQIKEVSAISTLTLNSLGLGGNKLLSIEPIVAQVQLTELYLENAGLTDISFISSMMQLRTLTLGYNDITDFSALVPLLKREQGNFQSYISFSFNDDKPVECWQKEYLDSLVFQSQLYWWPGHCKRGNDSLDYDKDGMNNRYEVDNGFNPYESQDGQLRKLRLGMLDFDGDGQADIAMRDAAAFGNYVLQSSNNKVAKTKFGLFAGDIPVAADYDGDGITDIAVRRPKDFMWYLLNSSDGKIQRVKFGLAAQDIPVVADYDGDGKADIAVFRPSHSMWYVLRSSDNEIQRLNFGYSKLDTPVVGDFDGDGKADFVLRRGGTGSWYMRLSADSSQQTLVQVYGRPDDVPVAADYDSDGKTDLGLYRASNHSWYHINSSDGSRSSRSFIAVTGAIPMVQDYDGDGKADIALRNPANFTQYVLPSSSGVLRTVKFGLNKNYIPFAAPVQRKIVML